MFDVGTNRPYYFNNTTQETLWVLPQDLNVIPVPLRCVSDTLTLFGLHIPLLLISLYLTNTFRRQI